MQLESSSSGAVPTRDERLSRLLADTARAARIGSWEVLLHERETYWSPVMKAIHGLPEEFVPTIDIGLRYYREGESRGRMGACVAAAMTSGTPWSGEFEIVTAAGECRWVRSTGACDFDEGGAARLYGTVQDIHEETVTRLALERSEELLRLTGEAARIGSWSVDVASGHIHYSDIVNEIHGLEGPQEWSAERALSFYVDGEEKDALLALYAACLTEGVPYETDFQIRTAQGAIKWIRARGRAHRDPGGRIDRLTGSFQDVDEERRASEELRRSERLLAHNFDNAPGGLAIADPEGRFLRVSKSLAKMLGYRRGELLRMRLSDVTHPDDVAQDRALFAEMAAGQREGARFEKRYRRRDGETVVGDVSVTCVRGGGGAPVSYYAQIVDVTAARREQQRRRYVANLEAKAQELSRFAYAASHDLRQPVLTVQGYLEALVEDAGEGFPPEADAYVEVMRAALARMDGMIQGLLDYSRVSRAKRLQIVDLDATVREVLADLHGLTTSTRAVITVGALPTVSGYPVELRQLFQNLLSNAMRYGRPGVAPEISVSASAIADGTEVCVEDNGRGVAPGDRERIFRLFQRGRGEPDAPDAGTGIGLATARLIAERHGGTLEVSAGANGQGSRFCFRILTEGLVENPSQPRASVAAEG